MSHSSRRIHAQSGKRIYIQLQVLPPDSLKLVAGSDTGMPLKPEQSDGVTPDANKYALHTLDEAYVNNEPLMGVKKKGQELQPPIPPVKVAMWVGDSVQMIVDTYTTAFPMTALIRSD